MAVDATMRKLKIPPKFVPYLEKHRIYELFHDLGNELAIAQPQDQLLFLKDCLNLLDKGRDRRLILLMAPPYLDRIRLAHLISVKTGCSILSRYLVCLKPGNHYDPDALAINTANIIKTSDKEGWILADFPDTVEEARLLIKSGVLPTHSFLFVGDEDKIQNEENENIRAVQTTPSILLEFDNSIYRLEELFKSSLKIVKLKDKSLEDIANVCARLTMKMPPRNAPKLFRVALIGPRGSRRRMIAKLLKKKLNLVHVDMDNLVNAARNAENDLGDEIRRLDKHGAPYQMKIVFQLLTNRLYQEDCLERGYVLTNFPCSIEDLVLLDSMDTPPNRVIVFDIDGSECQTRLDDRVVNMYTGSLHSKKAIKENPLLQSQALTHPDDESCKVAEEIKFYNKKVKSMLDYCGRTCSVIDGRGPITALLERVEAVLMGPSPASKPRSGKLPPRCVVPQQTVGVERQNLTYPVSRTDVVPLIDSEHLLKRFKELKKDHHHVTLMAEKSVEIVYDVDYESAGELSEKSGMILNVITVGGHSSTLIREGSSVDF